MENKGRFKASITDHLPGVDGMGSVSVGPGGGQGRLNSVGGGSVGGGNVGRGSNVSGVGSVSPNALHNWGRVSVSRVSHGGGMSVCGVGNGGSSVGLGDNWSMGSIADSRGSIADGGGSVGNWSLVGEVLLGGNGLDESGLLVSLHDGLSWDDVLLDSMGQDGGHDLLAVDDRAALVGHSGWDVVHMLSNLGDVRLLNDLDLGVHLGVSASRDDVLLDMGHRRGIAVGDQRSLIVAQMSSTSTSQDGGNNDLRRTRVMFKIRHCFTVILERVIQKVIQVGSRLL